MAGVESVQDSSLYSRLVVCMRAGGEAGQLMALTWRLPCADPGQKRRSERRPRTVVC